MSAGVGPGPGIVVAGRYRISELIGQGGMGSVWLAADELLGREVAIKRIRLDALTPTEAAVARERTMREARIAAALHHPHIVTIFDVIIEAGEPWLVLEYLPSRSLGDILSDHGTLPPSDVAAIGAVVADALAAAHRAGIVHRDVKPENILVADPPDGTDAFMQRHPTIKLTDFGIAHATAAPALTATGVLTGTPSYLAPETARGEGTDPRSDIYSLGATLYAATEGHPPFGHHYDVLVLLARIGHGNAPTPQRAGPLTGLVRRLLHDDPNTRPTAAEASRALRRIADPPAPGSDDSTLITASSASRPGTQRGTRRRIVLAGIGLLAAAAVASVIITTAPRGPAAPDPQAPVSTSPTAPAVPPELAIPDPRAADPCSLVDPSALSSHGQTTVNVEDAMFAQCRADIAQPAGGPVGFYVEFLSRAEAVDAESPGLTYEQVGPVTVARYPGSATQCRRRIVLPDGNGVLISANRSGGAAADLCAIAESGTVAAVDILTERGIGARVPPDARTALAGVDACGLLGPDGLAGVPGLETVAARPGFAGWKCAWRAPGRSANTVFSDFYRDQPLAELGREATEFSGHPGVLAPRLAGDGSCVALFVQGFDTGATGTDRVDLVRIFVLGSEPDDVLCDYARALAGEAAAKLPPPG